MADILNMVLPDPEKLLWVIFWSPLVMLSWGHQRCRLDFYFLILGLLWYDNQLVKQEFHSLAQTPATRLYN
jgi:hypothetical protein